MICVFAGPTLAPADVAAGLPDAVCLPPAARGDLYRVARERPRALLLVDGCFDRVAAVQHKEVLWALAAGVRVFGAASLGALRAAELAPFGMVGVGAIYEAFRSGALADDDEVAVAHADAESGYRALSDAMVDLRATVDSAVAAGVIARASGAWLVGAAKARFYVERSIAALVSDGRRGGVVPAAELAALAAWLPGRRVQQKRLDALSLLHHARAALDGPPPPLPRWRFEHTDAFETLRREAEARPLPAPRIR